MRRAGLVLVAAAGMAAGKDKAPAPRAIPAERQEEISRRVIAVQQGQIAALKADVASLQAQIGAMQAGARRDSLEAEYLRLLDALRKEFSADGCELRVDKTWNCPAPVKSEAQGKGEAEKSSK